MSTLAAIEAAIAGWPKPRLDGATVVVPTLCLYPSNGIVNVYVEGGDREFLIHDRGAAIEQLHSSVGMKTKMCIAGDVIRRGDFVVLGESDGSMVVNPICTGKGGIARAPLSQPHPSGDQPRVLINRYRGSVPISRALCASSISPSALWFSQKGQPCDDQIKRSNRFPPARDQAERCAR
jgi:hypothetical protein